MKRITIIGFVFILLQGCIIYPKFKHVYTTPDFTSCLLDLNNEPIPNAVVQWNGNNDISDTTDFNGNFYLPANRKYKAFDMVAMDMSPYLLLKINDKANDSISLIKIEYYCHSCKEIVVLKDTVKLSYINKINVP